MSSIEMTRPVICAPTQIAAPPEIKSLGFAFTVDQILIYLKPLGCYVFGSSNFRRKSVATMVTVMMIISQISLSNAIRCYDSQSAEPERVRECAADEMCYSEYYALKVSPDIRKAVEARRRKHNKHAPQLTMAQYYDRFCVHQKHCINRGLTSERRCLSISDLDGRVRETFENKLRSERLDPRRLLYTQFCCCSDGDLCNNISPYTVAKTFNLTKPNMPHVLDGRSYVNLIADRRKSSRSAKAQSRASAINRLNGLSLIFFFILFICMHNII